MCKFQFRMIKYSSSPSSSLSLPIYMCDGCGHNRVDRCSKSRLGTTLNYHFIFCASESRTCVHLFSLPLGMRATLQCRCMGWDRGQIGERLSYDHERERAGVTSSTLITTPLCMHWRCNCQLLIFANDI
jgi:hypothetical protein